MTIYKHFVWIIFYMVVLSKASSLMGMPLHNTSDKHKHAYFRVLCYKNNLNYLATEQEHIFSGMGQCPFCNYQIQNDIVNTLEFRFRIYRSKNDKMNIIESPSALVAATYMPNGDDLFIVTRNGIGKITGDGNILEMITPFEKKDGILVQCATFSPSGKYAVICLADHNAEQNTDAQRIVYAYDVTTMTGEKYSFGTKTPIGLIYIDEDTAVITTEDKYVYVEQVKNQAVSFRVEERKEDQGIIIGFHKGETICLQKSVSIDEKDQVELISPFFKEGKILFNEDYMYVLSEKENLWLRGSSGKIYKMNKDGLLDLTTTIEKDVVSWGLLDAGGIWINTNDEGIMTLLSDLRLVEENRERTN